jgi:hypothetical protein
MALPIFPASAGHIPIGLQVLLMDCFRDCATLGKPADAPCLKAWTVSSRRTTAIRPDAVIDPLMNDGANNYDPQPGAAVQTENELPEPLAVPKIVQDGSR